MHDEFRANRKTRLTSLRTPVNLQIGFSTPATWAPKIPAQKLGSALNNYRKPLGGKQGTCCATTQPTHTASYHVDLNMDSIVTAVRHLFGLVTGVRPQFRAHGGTAAENLALQNIQVNTFLTPGHHYAELCFRRD
jgi:hypothetical protein